MGALTLKNGNLGLRIWELKNIKTIDESDVSFNSIIHQIRGNNLIRILPHIDNQFLHNNSQHNNTTLQNNITYPFYFNLNSIIPINWYLIDKYFEKHLNIGNKIGYIISNQYLDLFSLSAFKYFINFYGFIFHSGIYRNAIFYQHFFTSLQFPELTHLTSLSKLKSNNNILNINTNQFSYLFNLLESRTHLSYNHLIIQSSQSYFKYNHNTLLHYFGFFSYPESSIPNKYYLNILDDKPNHININLNLNNQSSIKSNHFNIYIGKQPNYSSKEYLYIPLSFPYKKYYLNINGKIKNTSLINLSSKSNIGKNILQYISNNNILQNNISYEKIGIIQTLQSYKKDIYREYLHKKYNSTLYNQFKFFF